MRRRLPIWPLIGIVLFLYVVPWSSCSKKNEKPLTTREALVESKNGDLFRMTDNGIWYSVIGMVDDISIAIQRCPDPRCVQHWPIGTAAHELEDPSALIDKTDKRWAKSHSTWERQSPENLTIQQASDQAPQN
jgi:hypothetical protein